MKRRHLLCCGAALGAGLFTALALPAARAMHNPCRGALPRALADHPLVHAAFDGLDVHALWDVHAHLLGTGDAGSGCTVHPSMHQWWQPVEVLRRRAILNAACVDGAAPSIDRAYVDSLHRLAADFPRGARWLLYAFEQAHDDTGAARPDWTTFHVPNAYAAQVAAAAPERFGWVASVHPYRADAIERLDAALADGALAVKWLPSAMNIDLASPRCRPFYDRLRATGVPLIVHCGEEKAVPGAGRDAYGNPLLVRAPLEAGVRVIVAHAASLGHALDLDRRSRPRRAAFDLFARLMDERAHEPLLMADVSAAFQVNRPARIGRTLLRRADWHPRLLHGSDHPLPGVMALYRPERLAAEGLLDRDAVLPLREIRRHNALLFDLVLKRALRDGDARLSDVIFDTRSRLQRAAIAPSITRS
jgi:predicted TIM-barrel fold metal-dependent hydrolase